LAKEFLLILQKYFQSQLGVIPVNYCSIESLLLLLVDITT